MDSNSGVYFDRRQIAAKVPLWREVYSGVDWLLLRSSPVYYGIGVPRGDKSAVVLVPGFMATDFYLQEMYYWLHRVGYRPYMSRIGRNADCLDVLQEKLGKTIERAYAETGRPVHLIGHSLGGILSIGVAARMQDKIASINVLGSPFRGIHSHALVLAAGQRVSQRLPLERKRSPKCFTADCNCKTIKNIQQPPARRIPFSAIYTKTDGVVDWHKCISDRPDDNHEVRGTHIGLAFNPEVYRLIAANLHGKGRAGQI
jgi:triacylglycerol lipase